MFTKSFIGRKREMPRFVTGRDLTDTMSNTGSVWKRRTRWGVGLLSQLADGAELIVASKAFPHLWKSKKVTQLLVILLVYSISTIWIEIRNRKIYKNQDLKKTSKSKEIGRLFLLLQTSNTGLTMCIWKKKLLTFITILSKSYFLFY